MKQNQFSQIPYIWWQLVRAYKVDGRTVYINHTEIALLSILDNLGKGVKDGGGYASNEYLGRCINVKQRTVTKYLAELEAVGLIKTFHSREKGSHITTMRKVYVQHTYINKMIDGWMTTEGSSSTDMPVLPEAVAQTGISTSTDVSKVWHEQVEGVAQTCRSTSTGVLPNITRIQQEYINNRTYNTEHECTPNFVLNDTQEEIDISGIPDEMADIVSTCNLLKTDIQQCFKATKEVCDTHCVSLAYFSRFWVSKAQDNNSSCVTTYAEFLKMLDKVIIELMKRKIKK